MWQSELVRKNQDEVYQDRSSISIQASVIFHIKFPVPNKFFGYNDYYEAHHH